MLNAFFIGCIQSVAVIPGISRSGSTITAGLFSGCRRDFAVKFSFLLSIPAIIGAYILSISDAVKSGIDTSLLPAYLIGTAVAAAAGYFAIRLVKLLADKGKFGKFAYYCWAVGLIYSSLLQIIV
jgi:undecaprenyl-diphosphatase